VNLSIPVGILIGVSVMIYAVYSDIANPMVFLNIHAILIVFGGTFAAALVCFRFTHLLNMAKVLWRQLTGSFTKQRKQTIDEIVRYCELAHQGELTLDEIQGQNEQSFLAESLKLLSEETLSEDELTEVLEMRLNSQEESYLLEEKTFKSISRFPPAFGLIGATLGMIGLLQGLGSPDAFQTLGPTMSTALTATFWGLCFANLLLIPIGENLSVASENDIIQRRIVIEGIKLIKQKKHPLVALEYLSSYLTPAQRKELKLSENYEA
jgi:chemotaxis protein MotA